MKRNRELFLPFIVMVSCVILTVAVMTTSLTLAYLKDNDEKVNTFTPGETVIEITEEFPDPDDVPGPGEAVVKVVQIENTGNLTCTVRARLVFEDNILESITEPLLIGSGWREGPDGFYYYLSPIEPGGITEPLINEVKFRRKYEDGTVVSHADIARLESGLIVYSEALEFSGSGEGLWSESAIMEAWGNF